MQNIKKEGRIYLSGGGNEKQSFPLDKFFFDILPKSGSFLYIPIALRGHKLYLTADLWMKGVLELHERTDVQFEIATTLSKYNLEILKKFDGIYIGGGNTWSLIQEMRDSGFANILIEYFQDGGKIYGGSAGAIILGKRIDTHDDENNVELQNTLGFNVLNNFSVTCHFRDDQNSRFKVWAVKNNLPIICLPEETGLLIKKNVASCVGTKSCIVYLADGAQKEINPKESFNL